MQKEFHYDAAFLAAVIAGYTHEEAVTIACSDQFVDDCTKTLLRKLQAPVSAATTQSMAELAEIRPNILALQDITRIWASFHFLPFDLAADPHRGGRAYKNKYRLICNSNGPLVEETVKLARGKGLQAAGLAMHVLCDTWAHKYFAGTPSLVINNVNYYFREILEDQTEREISFHHTVAAQDDVFEGRYHCSLYQNAENSVMNLGHGRAGHFPDYSFARYKYLPAWGDYAEVIKDNPSDYLYAFAQMVQALRFLKGDAADFGPAEYAWAEIAPYREKIEKILCTRQADAEADWKQLGEKVSGRRIPAYDAEIWQREYLAAGEAEKENTFLGRFILAALAQKSMVTQKIYESGNLLAGISINYHEKGFGGIRDYAQLIRHMR